MKKKILLADDSITIQKIVELTLSDRFDVRCAGDGAAALKAFDEFQPDLVLCDAVMPAKSGYEVCADIKGRSRVPVVMLHGAFEAFDAGKAKQSGADSTLAKPFDTQALLDSIGSLLYRTETPPAPAPETGAAPETASAGESSLELTVDSAFAAFETPAKKTEAEEMARLDVAPLESEAERTMNVSKDEIARMMQQYSSGGGAAEPSKAEPAPEPPPPPQPPAPEPEPQEPESYYEKPEQMTDDDKRYAQEMAQSSSVPLDEMLPEDLAPAVRAEAAAPAPVPTPVVEPEEKVSLDDDLEEGERTVISMRAPAPLPEDMPTTELLKDVGSPAPSAAPAAPLDEKAVEAIVERVLNRMLDKMVRDIVWQVVPDMAEVLIKKKIDEIEKAVEQQDK